MAHKNIFLHESKPQSQQIPRAMKCSENGLIRNQNILHGYLSQVVNLLERSVSKQGYDRTPETIEFISKILENLPFFKVCY